MLCGPIYTWFELTRGSFGSILQMICYSGPSSINVNKRIINQLKSEKFLGCYDCRLTKMGFHESSIQATLFPYGMKSWKLRTPCWTLCQQPAPNRCSPKTCLHSTFIYSIIHHVLSLDIYQFSCISDLEL